MTKARSGRGERAKDPLRDPTPDEAAAIAGARARKAERAPRIALQDNLQTDGQHRLSLTSPHSDTAGWTDRLHDAFGTTSHDFTRSELARILMVASAGQQGDPHPQVANAMLAAVQGAQPANEVEAMLAVQMAATHDLAMTLLTNAKAKARTGEGTPAVEAQTAMAVKLMRTFTAQTEALAKLRRGGEQKVTVEHVHVYAGGQAVVGHVTGPGGGQIGNERQPYAITDGAAIALSAGAPVLCQDPGGARMSVPSREGEAAVPDARRGKRQRRAQG